MKQFLKSLLPLLVFLSFSACKQNENSNEEKFFPVLSFIKSQVKDIDTSLYQIRKLVYIDSLRTDTIFLHRDKFREEAKDFLAIPDIASSEYQKRYKEEKQVDETLNRVLLIYTPINPQEEIIQREEVLIKPDPSGDKVTNIIINSLINTKDSLVEKKLLWRVGESFLVTTTRQLPGQQESTSTIKVVWNESE
jgi:hypothetical protein